MFQLTNEPVNQQEVDMMRLMKKRIWILVIVLACLAKGFWWWAESGKVELEIGKDTTYITGPLNEDGTVNYVAHINAQLSEGVTPDMAVQLLRGHSLSFLDMLIDLYETSRMRSEILHVAVVLALHEAETGHFPAKLADLAPTFVKAVPNDRFGGKALVYKRDGKGCIVYSVGMNLADDGGIDNGDNMGRASEDSKDIAVRFKR